ncbi:MAG: LacI family DNA-binding transcriptional regulator [Treponema sp.]
MTVTEIAKKANVSIGTVDRVLHNRGRVSSETEAKINRIIEESGYHTNPLARHLKRSGSYKIGLLVPKMSYESGYWKQILEGVKEGVEEFDAFNFSLEDFEFFRTDENSLVEKFNELVNSECDAWIIAPVMQNVIEKCILNCNEEKVKPYCFIDSDIPLAKSFCAIHQDAFKAGALAAKLTYLTSAQYKSKLSGVEKTFAIILPYTEAYNLNERADGFCKWFCENKKGKALKIFSKDSTIKSVEDEIDNLLKENSYIGGICIANAVSHIAGNYVDSLFEKENEIVKGKKRISIVGFDLVKKNCDCLKSGKIDCLISQAPVEQGKIAVRQIYKKLVLEEEVPVVVEMPLEIYFKENV